MPIQPDRPRTSRRDVGEVDRGARGGLRRFDLAALLVCACLLAGGLICTAGCRAVDAPDEPRAASVGPESNTDASTGTTPDDLDGPPPPYKPHRLDGFYRALLQAEDDEQTERVSVLHVGDSHTASDTITGRLRELFQDRFGDGGRGFAYPGKPWRTYRQENMDYEMSDGWETFYGTSDEDPGPFPAGGLRVETSEEDAWLERSTCENCRHGARLDAFEIHYMMRPDGGAFTVSVDDQPATVVETDADEPRFGVYKDTVERGSHTVRVEAVGDGPIGLFGIQTHLGRNGLQYHTMAINGASATQFGSFDRTMTREQIQAIAPDVMVFAFGTNEAYNFYEMERSSRYSFESITQAMARYNTEFHDLLERYTAAAPQAACIVMLPPDLSPERKDVPCRREVDVGRGEPVCVQPPPRNFSGVIATQRVAAEMAGCAVWDQTKAMGGAGTISVWGALDPPLANSDGIHLTMAGYNLLAESFYNDVIKTYEIWKRGGQLKLPTTPIQPRAVAGAFGP